MCVERRLTSRSQQSCSTSVDLGSDRESSHPDASHCKRIVEKIVPDKGKDSVDDSCERTRQSWRTGTEEMFMGVDTGRRHDTRIMWQKPDDRSTVARLNFFGSGKAWVTIYSENVFKVRYKSEETNLDEAETHWKGSGRHSAGCIHAPASAEKEPSQLIPGTELRRWVTHSRRWMSPFVFARPQTWPGLHADHGGLQVGAPWTSHSRRAQSKR